MFISKDKFSTQLMYYQLNTKMFLAVYLSAKFELIRVLPPFMILIMIASCCLIYETVAGTGHNTWSTGMLYVDMIAMHMKIAILCSCFSFIYLYSYQTWNVVNTDFPEVT